METYDGISGSEDEASQSRIKPRRIDAPHAAAPANDAPIEEIPSKVAADACVGAADAAEGESPVFHEVAGHGSSPWNPDVVSSEMLELLTPLPDEESPSPSDDVQLEAEQLTAALEEQLRELQQREEILSARETELEQNWQDCRAWHQQQLTELDHREAELTRRQAEMEAFSRRAEELAERLRDCEAREAAVDQRATELNEREATLVAQDHELRQRRQEIERQAAALTRAQQVWEQSRAQEQQILERQRRQLQSDLDEQTARITEKLEAAQAALEEQTRDVDRQRQLLRHEREAWQQQRQQDDQQRLHQQSQAQEECDRRLAAVAARESALDTQQAALEQLREEMTAAYRQALEMRLIAEQLWAQVKGLMTPAEITQSVAQLRLKMAAQYELEEKAITERKEELLALADKLAQQHATLKAQRMEFLSWRKSQQEEIALQAEHLCRRVQELSEEQKRIKQAEVAWHSERRQLEERLRESTSRRAA